MIWYKHLYVDEDIVHKQKKIKWKICHNAGQLDMYVISLPDVESNLLEIISTVELMQKHYPKGELFVVGLAKGYEKAQRLAAGIVTDIFNKTGKFNVKEYLHAMQYADADGSRV